MTQALLREELGRLYSHVDHFREGLAAVVNKDGEWFHIRLNGTPAYAERFDSVGKFNEGLAWVNKGGEWSHIRPDGTRVNK